MHHATAQEAGGDAVTKAAMALWDYHQMHQTPQPADLIFAAGSHDLRVADRAADRFLQGLATRMLFSGGLGRLTAQRWSQPEAVLFAEAARRRGVPEAALLLETRSTNTGENVVLSRQMLAERGLAVRSLIGVHKPYMERRFFATLRKQWPEVEVRVTSPQFSFETYCAGAVSRDEVIAIMVGDFQRVLLYPARGFAIAQEVPPAAAEACQFLIQAGYTGHLPKEARA
jgi:uncharacterized SAM-binding protein YcdF (DUF218 family)